MIVTVHDKTTSVIAALVVVLLREQNNFHTEVWKQSTESFISSIDSPSTLSIMDVNNANLNDSVHNSYDARFVIKACIKQGLFKASDKLITALKQTIPTTEGYNLGFCDMVSIMTIHYKTMVAHKLITC